MENNKHGIGKVVNSGTGRKSAGVYLFSLVENLSEIMYTNADIMTMESNRCIVIEYIGG